MNKPIVISENFWCGYNATILHGVTIGDNASVGSSVIIMEGVSAETVRKFETNKKI